MHHPLTVFVVCLSVVSAVVSTESFDEIMTRLRVGSAAMLRRLINSHRIEPWMLIPFLNYRIQKINAIVGVANRCLNTPLCHRLIQHVDLLNYDRKWYMNFMGYNNIKNFMHIIA